MNHCASCDLPLHADRFYFGPEGPLCWICHQVRVTDKIRKARAMNTATELPVHPLSTSDCQLSIAPEEAVDAVINRTALRIPTTNRVIFAGRISRHPMVVGKKESMIAIFQVVNEDPDHPSETEVCMKGPAAEFCRTLRRGQAVVIDGRIDSRVISHNCLVTRIAATFIEPLQ